MKKIDIYIAAMQQKTIKHAVTSACNGCEKDKWNHPVIM